MNFEFTVEDKRHPLYNTWWNMLARCYIPIAPGFENYGGRGIRVVKRWLKFTSFAKDMGGLKIKGLTLDRINNDGNYSPSNCKWASHSEQMFNRRQFGNNRSGETGVVNIANRFEARFHSDGVRYRIGRFDTILAAKSARDEFIKLFKLNKESAIATIPDKTVWCTTSTNVRGVTPHKDGGFIVRVTRNKIRHYIGYFQTLDEAIDARREFDKK